MEEKEQAKTGQHNFQPFPDFPSLFSGNDINNKYCQPYPHSRTLLLLYMLSSCFLWSHYNSISQYLQQTFYLNIYIKHRKIAQFYAIEPEKRGEMNEKY